jgi:hypothetical protein
VSPPTPHTHWLAGWLAGNIHIQCTASNQPTTSPWTPPLDTPPPRLVKEYLDNVPASSVEDLVDTCSATGGSVLKMVHTHEGAAAVCMMLAYGSAKDRKRLVKVRGGAWAGLAAGLGARLCFQPTSQRCPAARRSAAILCTRCPPVPPKHMRPREKAAPPPRPPQPPSPQPHPTPPHPCRP